MKYFDSIVYLDNKGLTTLLVNCKLNKRNEKGKSYIFKSNKKAVLLVVFVVGFCFLSSSTTVVFVPSLVLLSFFFIEISRGNK